jgi:tripartite-type tricarboxylate transporter receptor subunit TctC
VGHIKAGRLRPLLVTNKERIQISPFQNIPSLFEKGYNGPEFAAVTGVEALKEASDETVNYLEEKFKLVSEDQEFIDGMNQVV